MILAYVGIAEVSGARGFTLPVYRSAYGEGGLIGQVVAGGYVPHFMATDDYAWLNITLHSGEGGWMSNDPAHVTINLPDPNRVRVVIDPGHGGTEMGSQARGLVEKSINFDVAYNRLRPLLVADGRIDQVWFTRNGDYDVSLAYRWDLGNAAFANLFVSVHQNEVADPAVLGTETYYKCGSEGTDVIIGDSRRAACLLHRRLQEQFAANACPWSDRGIICRQVSPDDRRTYYYVLQNTNLPAVLSEALYLSNPDQAACIVRDGFRTALARGIYNGITDFLFTDAPGTGCMDRLLYGL